VPLAEPYVSSSTTMVAAPSKCRPSAAALVVAPPAAPRRRLRCRCCEDTLGVPRRRLQPQLHLKQQAPAATTAPAAAPPPRPRRIVLVRHGESEGNVDEAAYTRVPDPRIGLTAKGWREADDCGRRLRDLFSSGSRDQDDWKVYFYASPYRRSLETLRGIGHAFEPHRIAGVREEPRLREQDFGTVPSFLSCFLIHMIPTRQRIREILMVRASLKASQKFPLNLFFLGKTQKHVSNSSPKAPLIFS
jgi:hypothetical protein